jgi:phosphatidylglycerol:prolipoprotein diacylglycerol transferase
MCRQLCFTTPQFLWDFLCALTFGCIASRIEAGGLPLYTEVGPLRLQTFTVALALAIITSIGIGIARRPGRYGAVADACIGALIVGLVAARAGHVLLNWEHFAFNAREILRLHAGGFDWHGALMGGLLGLYLVGRARRVDVPRLLDALTWALPLLMMAGWWGCAAANCAYGAEVDNLSNYPGWLVAERPDVYGIPAPRYHTQQFGFILGLIGLAFTVLLFWRRWFMGERFWLVLTLLSAGMYAIGFTRGDFAVVIAGWRADQWFDLGVLLLCGLMLIRGSVLR